MNEIIKLARTYHDTLSIAAYWPKWRLFALGSLALYLTTVALVSVLVLKFHAAWLALAPVPFFVIGRWAKQAGEIVKESRWQSIRELYGFSPINTDEAHIFFLKHIFPSASPKEYLAIADRIEQFQRAAQQAVSQSPFDEKGFLGLAIGFDEIKKQVRMPFLFAVLVVVWQLFLTQYKLPSTISVFTSLTEGDLLAISMLFLVVFMLGITLLMLYKILAEFVNFYRVQFTESDYADQVKVNALRACLIRYGEPF